MKYGKLRIKVLRLELADNVNINSVKVRMGSGGKAISQTHRTENHKLKITIDRPAFEISESQNMEVDIEFYTDNPIGNA